MKTKNKSIIINADYSFELFNNIREKIAHLPSTANIKQIIISEDETQALIIYNELSGSDDEKSSFIMNFFRSDEFIDILSEEKLNEIAFACLSYSDRICKGLEDLMKEKPEEE